MAPPSRSAGHRSPQAAPVGEHRVVRSEGVTSLVATHDAALMDLADDILQLEDGTITK
jgi:ABC-type protease/lipase transport system fused ATPase/permease subunit